MKIVNEGVFYIILHEIRQINLVHSAYIVFAILIHILMAQNPSGSKSVATGLSILKQLNILLLYSLAGKYNQTCSGFLSMPSK